MFTYKNGDTDRGALLDTEHIANSYKIIFEAFHAVSYFYTMYA